MPTDSCSLGSFQAGEPNEPFRIQLWRGPDQILLWKRNPDYCYRFDDADTPCALYMETPVATNPKDCPRLRFSRRNLVSMTIIRSRSQSTDGNGPALPLFPSFDFITFFPWISQILISRGTLSQWVSGP